MPPSESWFLAPFDRLQGWPDGAGWRSAAEALVVRVREQISSWVSAALSGSRRCPGGPFLALGEVVLGHGGGGLAHLHREGQGFEPQCYGAAHL